MQRTALCIYGGTECLSVEEKDERRMKLEGAALYVFYFSLKRMFEEYFGKMLTFIKPGS